MKIIEIIKR